MMRLNASLYYIAKLSKTMKWLKIKMPLSCQNCPVIDGRLTVECPLSKFEQQKEQSFESENKNEKSQNFQVMSWLQIKSHFSLVKIFFVKILFHFYTLVPYLTVCYPLIGMLALS